MKNVYFPFRFILLKYFTQNWFPWRSIGIEIDRIIDASYTYAEALPAYLETHQVEYEA